MSQRSGARGHWRPVRTPGRHAILALVVLALAWVSVAPASAREAVSTLDEYEESVSKAFELSRMVLADDSVTAEEARNLSDLVGSLLPESQLVSMGADDVMTVDNTVISSLATRLGVATDSSSRTEIAQDIEGHLAAQVIAVGEPGATVGSDTAALEALLSEQQIQERNPMSEWFAALVDRLGEFLMGWWDSAGANPAVASTLRIVTIVMLTLMALGLLWMLVRIVMHLRAGTSKRAARPRMAGDAAIVAAAEGLPVDALAHADELAAREHWRDAVRALFGGAARELVAAGYILEAHRRTNGELLLEIRPAAPHVYEPLAALCALFERAWYGHHEPGGDGYTLAREEFTRVLERLAEEPPAPVTDTAQGGAS